jgi:hypothetical protein
MKLCPDDGHGCNIAIFIKYPGFLNSRRGNGFIKKESAGTRTGITTTHTGMGEGVGVYVCVCGETASVKGADSTGMVQNIHSVGIFYYKIFSQ